MLFLNLGTRFIFILNIMSSFRYSIMHSCWAAFPEGRPTFTEIVEMLQSIQSSDEQEEIEA